MQSTSLVTRVASGRFDVDFATFWTRVTLGGHSYIAPHPIVGPFVQVAIHYCS